MRVRPALVTAVIAVALAMLPVTAFAYDGNAAANHADRYTTSYDTQYQFFVQDCSNFTSQNLSAGGYPYRRVNGSTTDDHNWWYDKVFYSNTHSWSVSNDLHTFLYWDVPGGFPKGTTSGNSNTGSPWNRWPSNMMGLIRGDVLFYDWGDGQGWFHNSMLVVIGGYSYHNNWYGDLIDAHTSDRYHAFWDLSEYNSLYYQTTVEAWHIDAGNR